MYRPRYRTVKASVCDFPVMTTLSFNKWYVIFIDLFIFVAANSTPAQGLFQETAVTTGVTRSSFRVNIVIVFLGEME